MVTSVARLSLLTLSPLHSFIHTILVQAKLGQIFIWVLGTFKYWHQAPKNKHIFNVILQWNMKQFNITSDWYSRQQFDLFLHLTYKYEMTIIIAEFVDLLFFYESSTYNTDCKKAWWIIPMIQITWDDVDLTIVSDFSRILEVLDGLRGFCVWCSMIIWFQFGW